MLGIGKAKEKVDQKITKPIMAAYATAIFGVILAVVAILMALAAIHAH